MGFRFQVLVFLVSLAWLWFQLINHLRVEWSLNEQYHFGWAVPFLALYLVWQGRGGRRTRDSGLNPNLNPNPSEPGKVDHEIRKIHERGQGAEVGGQRSEVSGQWSVVSGLQSDNPGFRSQASGLPTEESFVPSPSSAVQKLRSQVSGFRFVRWVSGFRFSRASLVLVLLLVILCLLYLPTRLIQVANPEWRLVSWALALEVIGITLLLLIGVEWRGQWSEVGGQRPEVSPDSGFRSQASGFPTEESFVPSPSSVVQNLRSQVSGLSAEESLVQKLRFQVSSFRSVLQVSGFRFQVSHFVFPLCFFLVAVPWPTLIEGPLIQTLTRANASVTVEVLSVLGVPALQHGNIIEVSTGPVGIDDACSGIRSFQASLMIALFLGQLFRLTVPRRLLCVAAGFALSFVFNVGRTVLLTYVASVKGVQGIKSWHDPAGVTILVGCFLGLWAVAELLRREGRRTRDSGLNPNPNLGPPEPNKVDHEIREIHERGQGAEAGSQRSEVRGPQFEKLRSQVSGLRSVRWVSGFRFSRTSVVPGLLFFTWFLVVEVAVEGWYRWHERRMPAPVTWSVRLPEAAPDFRRLPIAERTRRILRFDDVLNATWTGPADSRWQTIFLRWNPGRTAVHLAKNHTPEVCLSSAGRSVVSQSEVQWYEAARLKMPFRVYQVTDPTGPLHVFYCLWDDRASAQGVETMRLTYENRLAPVLAGRRQSGQRSLEVAIWGYADVAEAGRMFRETLPKLVAVE